MNFEKISTAPWKSVIKIKIKNRIQYLTFELGPVNYYWFLFGLIGPVNDRAVNKTRGKAHDVSKGAVYCRLNYT